MRLVLLDAGRLGMLTNPAGEARNAQCREWAERLLTRGDAIAVPEVADYEVRRELVRAEKTQGLGRLNALRTHPAFLYVPLTTATMDKAAEFWALMRRQHAPTAPTSALDGDVILAAQAWLPTEEGYDTVVATTDPAHLSRLVPAAAWTDV